MKKSVLLSILAISMPSMGFAADADMLDRQIASPGECHISSTSVGGVSLGETVGDIVANRPNLTLRRVAGMDGIDILEARLGTHVLWRSEIGFKHSAEQLPRSTIITNIETFSASCRDGRMVGPGVLLSVAADRYGGIEKIVRSNYEQREFVFFNNSPPGLVIRIDNSGIFPSGSNETTSYRPDGRILSVRIERP